MDSATLATLLDPVAISRAETLGMHARYLVEGYMAGEHKSPYHGFAIEFAFEHWLHSEQPAFRMALNISSILFLLLYCVMVTVHFVRYLREQVHGATP